MDIVKRLVFAVSLLAAAIAAGAALAYAMDIDAFGGRDA